LEVIISIDLANHALTKSRVRRSMKKTEMWMDEQLWQAMKAVEDDMKFRTTSKI
jgi:hypothetical protein